MGVTHLSVPLLIIATILRSTNCICPRKAQIGALVDILSPANTEKALQLLSMAALGPKPVKLVEEIAVPRCPGPAVPRCPGPVVPSVIYPEIQPPRRVFPVIERPQDFYPAVVSEIVYPGVPIPQPCACQTPRVVPGVYPAVPEFYPAVPEFYPSAPMPMVNPFLPAASPVSAFAPPTSTLLPPIDPTKVRSQYLRKIPIPPPCL